MAARFCHSCMVPLDAPALWGPVAHLCRNCTDAAGKLKARSVVRKDIAEWLRSWQPAVDEAESIRRADLFMRSLPAWAVEETAAATPETSESAASAKPAKAKPSRAKPVKKAKPKAKADKPKAKPAVARKNNTA